MFSAIRQGSPFYILEKGDDITLKVGRVDSVSAPRPKYSTYAPYTQESTVDIRVKVGDTTMEFNNVPSNLTIANFGSSNVIISESTDAIQTEIDGMLQSSKRALDQDTLEYHRRVVKSCDAIAKQLNPAYAKEQERDKALSMLQDEVSVIKDSLQQIINSLPKG